MKENSPRIIIDPLNDALLQTGNKYLGMIGHAAEQQKMRQFSNFLMLLEDRIESGEKFTFPSEKQISTDQLMRRDSISEGQSIKLVGKICKSLEARKNARY